MIYKPKEVNSKGGLIAIAKRHDCIWIAVDDNLTAYGYFEKPILVTTRGKGFDYWVGKEGTSIRLGKYAGKTPITVTFRVDGAKHKTRRSTWRGT